MNLPMIDVASLKQLRDLFVMMLMFCEISEPANLFETFVEDLSEDFRYQMGESEVTQEICGMVLAHMQQKNSGLIHR